MAIYLFQDTILPLIQGIDDEDQDPNAQHFDQIDEDPSSESYSKLPLPNEVKVKQEIQDENYDNYYESDILKVEIEANEEDAKDKLTAVVRFQNLEDEDDFEDDLETNDFEKELEQEVEDLQNWSMVEVKQEQQEYEGHLELDDDEEEEEEEDWPVRRRKSKVGKGEKGSRGKRTRAPRQTRIITKDKPLDNPIPVTALTLDAYVLSESANLRREKKKMLSGEGGFEDQVSEKQEGDQDDTKKVQLSDRKLYGCMFCTYSSRKYNWITHLKRHHKDQNLLYCSYKNCSMPAQDEKVMEEHIKNTHDIKANRHCQVCGKEFKFPYQLKMHMDVHLDKEEKKAKTEEHMCPYCGKVFTSRIGYK